MINVFESVDVISLIKGGVYDDLSLTVGEALLKRSDVCFSMFCSPYRVLGVGLTDHMQDFAGIYTCTLHDRLDAIFTTIRNSRVHRFVVIDERSKLKGVLSLGDVLEYILLEGEDTET